MKKRKRALPPIEGSDILKVDPISGHIKDGEILVTHDDQYGYTPYHVMLNIADISTGVNKFYRIQAIKIKGKKKYYFFISWGRVGVADIGGFKVYDKGTSEKAVIEAFEEKFLLQTGVPWEDRLFFEKKPGKYFMVALDDGNEDQEADEEFQSARKRVKKEKTENKEDKMDEDGKKNVLHPRVQKLISLIFDKEMMKNTLKALNVDIKKMPLGKISKNQIKEGYKALTEIQDILEDASKNKTEPNMLKIKDASNRFYTLIPHDFGRQQPPLIDSIEVVKGKIQLMDTLVDLEVAGDVMKEANTMDDEDPIFKNYKALKSKIEPLEKGSELYKMLETYAYNSHDDKYFSRFSFEVQDIFECSRDGENERFKSWAKNENRILLWHGSRLTNWVGIISTGLRIAPPEAPKTGYRFGKGVYFADIISKSGSYCFTSNESPDAVMLLAEVALGKTNDLLRDEYMEKPPPGTHSTKALGKTAPNPKQNKKILDDVTLPSGTPIDTGVKSACSHNEYIIYDVSQIQIRYLLHLKFKHKTGW